SSAIPLSHSRALSSIYLPSHLRCSQSRLSLSAIASAHWIASRLSSSSQGLLSFWPLATRFCSIANDWCRRPGSVCCLRRRLWLGSALQSHPGSSASISGSCSRPRRKGSSTETFFSAAPASRLHILVVIRGLARGYDTLLRLR